MKNFVLLVVIGVLAVVTTMGEGQKKADSSLVAREKREIDIADIYFWMQHNKWNEIWTFVKKEVPCNDKVINCLYDETNQAKVPIEDEVTWRNAWRRCCHTKVDQGKCEKENICSSSQRPSPSQRPVYDHRFVLELYHYLSKSDTADVKKMIKEGPCSKKLLSCWKDETDGYKVEETQSKEIVAGIQSCCEKEKENCFGQKICQAADKPAPPPPVDSNQADIQLVYFYLKHGKYNEIETIGGLSMKDPCNKAVISCWKTETKDATVDKWGEIHFGLKECCYSEKIDKKCQGSKLCLAL